MEGATPALVDRTIAVLQPFMASDLRFAFGVVKVLFDVGHTTRALHLHCHKHISLVQFALEEYGLIPDMALNGLGFLCNLAHDCKGTRGVPLLIKAADTIVPTLMARLPDQPWVASYGIGIIAGLADNNQYNDEEQLGRALELAAPAMLRHGAALSDVMMQVRLIDLL